MLRPGETALACELCGAAADYCDSIPDANLPGVHRGECGYRLKPLCWIHAAERRAVATSRVEQILRCETQGLGRLDRDRASGECRCPDCGRLYYDHPREQEHPFLSVLCDGSVVKL